MKFKDFQAPALFSSTFNALNLGEKIKYFQGLSRMRGNPASCQKVCIESKIRHSLKHAVQCISVMVKTAS